MPIRAAVYRGGSREARIEELSLMDLRDDEVLVRIVATGICHTDIISRDGMMPIQRPVVLGHEGAGVVERVGAKVRKVIRGDHVVLSFLFCGACPSCDAHKPFYCHSFFPANILARRFDGSSAFSVDNEPVGAHFFGQSSFSTHSVANERNVVKVRKDAPLELLGPLGCGVQTGAGTVMNVLRPKLGESFAVFGAGGVGLSAVMAAVIEGCEPIIAIEPNPERRALALSLGAHAAINPFEETDLATRIVELSKGGILHAIDTTGIPAVLAQIIEGLAPRGQLALLTTNAPDAVLSIPLLSLLTRGAVIRAVTEGESLADSFIPKLVDLIMEGTFPLQRLVRYYDFKDINAALDDQERGRVVKPILRMPAL